MMHAAAARAQSAPEPIRYTLGFPAPQTHYVEVTATVPTGRRPDVELMMAVWTPGSYLVREYERNIEGLTASGADGRALEAPVGHVGPVQDDSGHPMKPTPWSRA